MNEIEQRFFDELCERARADGCDLNMAAWLVAELNSAITEGRPVNVEYLPVLQQFLALNDVLNIQQIEWFPKG